MFLYDILGLALGALFVGGWLLSIGAYIYEKRQPQLLPKQRDKASIGH